MKVVTVVPTDLETPTLKTLLNQKEREIRGKGTTFIRQKSQRWVHARYPGWINWDLAPGKMLVAEVHSKRADLEWQLLQAFVGYLDRHVGEYISSIMITYR